MRRLLFGGEKGFVKFSLSLLFFESGEAGMEDLVEEGDWIEEMGTRFDMNRLEGASIADWVTGEGRESSSSLEMSTSEETGNEERSGSSSEDSSSPPPPLGWTIGKKEAHGFSVLDEEKTHFGNGKIENQGSDVSGMRISHLSFLILLTIGCSFFHGLDSVSYFFFFFLI